MRQIRTSGSEGGEAAIKAVFPTPITEGWGRRAAARHGINPVPCLAGHAAWPRRFWAMG